MLLLSGRISSSPIVCLIQILHLSISLFKGHRTVIWLLVVPSTNLKFNITKFFYIRVIYNVGINSITIVYLTECRVSDNGLKLKIL